MAEKWDTDEGVVTDTRRKTRQKTRLPRMYRVLLHNDDYTTREFVVEVLCSIFHRSEADAVAIMLNVHHNGVGVAGTYTLEIAETKVRTVESLARRQGFPLRLSIDPEE